MNYNYLDTYAKYLSPFIDGDISPENIQSEISSLESKKTEISNERDQLAPIYSEIQTHQKSNTRSLKKINRVVNDSLFDGLLTTKNINHKIWTLEKATQENRRNRTSLEQRDQELFDSAYAYGDTIASLQYILWFPQDWSEFIKIDYLTPIYRNILKTLDAEARLVLSCIAKGKDIKLSNNRFDQILSSLENLWYISKDISNYQINGSKWPYLEQYLKQSA